MAQNNKQLMGKIILYCILGFLCGFFIGFIIFKGYIVNHTNECLTALNTCYEYVNNPNFVLNLSEVSCSYGECTTTLN